MKIKRVPIGDLQANCYLLFGEKEVFVIDPGDGEIDKVVEAIGGRIVTKIINTHYHFDHTRNIEELKKITGAKVYLHKDDKKYADFEIDCLLSDGEKIIFDTEELLIINTPGHTQGSICIESENSVFTGDTFFENGYGRFDLPGGSSDEMNITLARRDEILDGSKIIYPGHGNEFKFS